MIYRDPEMGGKRVEGASLPLFEQESGLSSSTLKAVQCETGAAKKTLQCSETRAVPEIAHARRTDPQTSKDAARSVVNLGRTRDLILYVLRTFGPQTDEEIKDSYQKTVRTDENWASDSGLRSRRAELVRMGLVEACGTGKTAAGRDCTIWNLVRP